MRFIWICPFCSYIVFDLIALRNVNISEATEYLSKTLLNHLIEVCPEDNGIRFLREVARIVEFRNRGNLDEWQTAVLAVFNDAEWEAFVVREDFELFEIVWEVGRFNMYGAIQERETQKLYDSAARKVKRTTKVPVLKSENFDFSAW